MAALSEDQNQLIGSLDFPVVIDEDGTLAIPAGDVSTRSSRRGPMRRMSSAKMEKPALVVLCVVDDPLRRRGLRRRIKCASMANAWRLILAKEWSAPQTNHASMVSAW